MEINLTHCLIWVVIGYFAANIIKSLLQIWLYYKSDMHMAQIERLSWPTLVKMARAKAKGERDDN